MQYNVENSIAAPKIKVYHFYLFDLFYSAFFFACHWSTMQRWGSVDHEMGENGHGGARKLLFQIFNLRLHSWQDVEIITKFGFSFETILSGY